MEAEKKLLLPQNEHGAFLIRVNIIFFYFFGIAERSWMGAQWSAFRKQSKCVVFSFVYFTLDDHLEVFIMLLIRRAIIAHNHY